MELRYTNKSGAEIPQFCFDYWDNDILAFALKEEGTRELKLHQSLLFRDRTDNGFRVEDKELDTWNDCLHRYDCYSMTEKYKSSYKCITGAIDSLYYEKTINYAK